MLFKKREPEMWSTEDIKFQEVNDRIFNHRKTLINLCIQILECEGCINMLPECADANVEIDKRDELKKKVQNVLTAYDEDWRVYKAIDSTKFVHYTGKAGWADSHSMLKIAWRNAINSIYK